MKNIFICCGLGDCLIYCQIYDLYRDTFKYNYVVNINFITKYRDKLYINFMTKIFNLFNVPLKITYKEWNTDNELYDINKLLKEYPITNNTLTKYIPIIPNDLPKKYIVINLNIRFIISIKDKDKKIFNKMIEQLCYMLNNYIFRLPIVIIGHRNSFITHTINNYSFYDKLDISKFIDKSINSNIITNPDLNNLLYDINILKNAEETFQFGFGGSFCLNVLFSNKLSSIVTSKIDYKNEFLQVEYFSHFFNNISNIIIHDNYNDLLKRLNTFRNNNNILYILGHKTLTDFEVPILIKKNYGVCICKNFSSIDNINSLININDSYKYDCYIQNVTEEELNKINKIDWYNNNTQISEEVIDILNKKFKYIFITLLTKENLLTQLISKYKGQICYRFFGLETSLSYKPRVYNSQNIKYIFSYPEIFNFEISLKTNNNFFNYNNSYVIPLGIPEHIFKYEKTYNPLKNKICFVCSKIIIDTYYTNIYNNFIINLGKKYDYVLLGKNNEKINDSRKMNNLNDNDYYKTISECKLLYYHSTEPRHLHYHPLEAIIIGIPIIFYEKSLLNSYLNNSPGKCNNLNEVYLKIDRIFSNDMDFINKIILEQNKVIPLLKIENNINIFDNLLNEQFIYNQNFNSSNKNYTTLKSNNIKKKLIYQKVIQIIQEKKNNLKSKNINNMYYL